MDPTALALTGYRVERGLVWPDWDTRCAAVTFDEVERSLPVVLEHVGSRSVVVQAGGNCGPMVRRLAAEFAAVYTFEPDPVNFVALTINTAALRNVHRYQAALGAAPGFVTLKQGDEAHPDNCGALYAVAGGTIPTLQIDQLFLDACSLILLDVEGAEHGALVGSRRTIAHHRPTIVVEQKGLGHTFYGEPRGLVDALLRECHYVPVKTIGKDEIWRPVP